MTKSCCIYCQFVARIEDLENDGPIRTGHAPVIYSWDCAKRLVRVDPCRLESIWIYLDYIDCVDYIDYIDYRLF